MTISLILTSGLTLFVTWFLWNKVWENSRIRRAERQHGCGKIPKYRNRDPILGYDLFKKLQVADIEGRRSKAYQQLHRDYGSTFEMKALGPVFLQTADTENIQAICTTEFENFGVEPMRGRIGAPFMDQGIFMVDGEFWKKSRSLIRPTFNRAEIADLDNFETYLQRMLKLLPGDGVSFDMLPLSKRLVSVYPYSQSQWRVC